MAGVMERADVDAPGADPAVEQAYGTIVVVGGGCYGSYYVRQLRRAAARGALTYDRVLVVDRDPACTAAAGTGHDVELRVADWSSFFSAFLAAEGRAGDAIVPSPLMPHLLFQWLEQRARNRWPDREVTVRLPGAVGGIPWQREGKDGTRYVSFAEWICPVNCIEPRICPHTRGERTWSMPPSLAAHVRSSLGTDDELQASVIFHCTHRAYGVGMIDVDDVLAGDRTLVVAADGRRAKVLVGTVSHCHGALGILVVE
jgi:hypothetical protein